MLWNWPVTDFWQHILSGCLVCNWSIQYCLCNGYRRLYVESWWLSSCRSSVIEQWQIKQKPRRVPFPATAGFFGPYKISKMSLFPTKARCSKQYKPRQESVTKLCINIMIAFSSLLDLFKYMQRKLCSKFYRMLDARHFILWPGKWGMLCIASNPGFPFWICLVAFSPKLRDKIQSGKPGFSLSLYLSLSPLPSLHHSLLVYMWQSLDISSLQNIHFGAECN